VKGVENCGSALDRVGFLVAFGQLGFVGGRNYLPETEGPVGASHSGARCADNGTSHGNQKEQDECHPCQAVELAKTVRTHAKPPRTCGGKTPERERVLNLPQPGALINRRRVVDGSAFTRGRYHATLILSNQVIHPARRLVRTGAAKE